MSAQGMQKTFREIQYLAVVGVLLAGLFSGCATTNFDVERTESYAIAANTKTLLGDELKEFTATYPGNVSEFFPLADGTDSLGARLRLIDTAEESIDMQYFLMKDDLVGKLISYKLLEAADRGVRIRFLLDDIFSSVRDHELFVLNNHENIEVRLFNPIARRGFKNLNYLGDFKRANRRMHNKSFTVDGSMTIVGGRNLAAEYFNLKDTSDFFDLDVIALGPIAAEVSESFDEFWNYEKSLPLEYLKHPPSQYELELELEEIHAVVKSDGIEIYDDAIKSDLLQQLIQGKIPAFVAESKTIHESPLKLNNAVDDDSIRLINDIASVIEVAEEVLLVISPYFVPTSKGMAYWKSVVDKGVKVTIITNSLASTNHVPVHAAYKRYRKDLLKMGIQLYEARPDAGQVEKQQDQNKQKSTLHTKLIMVDERYVFIGSLNMDPRSVLINTEMGILIDSVALASSDIKNRRSILHQILYELELNEDGDIEWHTYNGEERVTYTKEPKTSWWRRFSTHLYKILPEGQL